MALSPNYGWSEPDNSSLVKNGAQDIRALGDAIDTSVWNVGYGQAGKNKFINGNFGIWQRGTTLGPTVALNQYLADRWLLASGGDTVTYSQQSFTAGSAPISNYESQYFARVATTFAAGASNFVQFLQRVEDVRTINNTMTISYYAKADAAKSIAIELSQNFGSGGSSTVLTFIAKQALTTSWARYSTTFTIPSFTGKTIGANSYADFRFWLSAGSNFDARTGSLGQQNITFDIWGVQVEYGSKATPFQTASGGSPQAELAMCQRYYQRITPTASGQNYGVGYVAANAGSLLIGFPVEMRTRPTALEQSGTATDYTVLQASGATVLNAVPTFTSSTTYNIRVNFPTAGILIDNTSCMGRSATTTAYLGWSAEL